MVTSASSGLCYVVVEKDTLEVRKRSPHYRENADVLPGIKIHKEMETYCLFMEAKQKQYKIQTGVTVVPFPSS